MVGASRGLEASEGEVDGVEADGGEADGEEVENAMMDGIRSVEMVRRPENCRS
jgi:hypothetical protein